MRYLSGANTVFLKLYSTIQCHFPCLNLNDGAAMNRSDSLEANISLFVYSQGNVYKVIYILTTDKVKPLSSSVRDNRRQRCEQDFSELEKKMLLSGKPATCEAVLLRQMINTFPS